jgi:hypothetical protein
MEIFLWPAVERLAEQGGVLVDRSSCLAEPWGTVTLPDTLGSAAYAASLSQKRSGAEDVDLELRKKLVWNLARCATHDYHKPSQTHLFFGYYAASCAVRSFHPFREKAFEVYLILANRLAMATDDSMIRGWIKYIEGNCSGPDFETHSADRDLPCSGVINFRLDNNTTDGLRRIGVELAMSLNKTTESIFAKIIPSIRKDIRREGVEKFSANIRHFYENSSSWQQHTVRISKPTHAVLLAIGQELSASVSSVASYIISNFLEMGSNKR